MHKEISTPWNTAKPATAYGVNTVRPYSLQELSSIYAVSSRTILKWLTPFMNDIGPRAGHFYTVRQVEMIFDKLGLPRRIRED